MAHKVHQRDYSAAENQAVQSSYAAVRARSIQSAYAADVNEGSYKPVIVNSAREISGEEAAKKLGITMSEFRKRGYAYSKSNKYDVEEVERWAKDLKR